MNVLEGFNDWDKVVVPVRSSDRLVKSIVLSKSCFKVMDDLGFRGIFRIDERRVSENRTNASTLEELAKNLPVEIKLVAGFDHKGEDRYNGLHVVLQGFTRDDGNNLVIKIDSPSRVNKRQEGGAK